MKDQESGVAVARRTRQRRRISPIWRWIFAFVVASLVALVVCAWLAIKRAEPILRARVIETLSTRFKSRVELAEFHVWIDAGLHAEGKGLKIFGPTDPNPSFPGVQPLLQIDTFRFGSSVRSLFHQPMRLDTIFVDGLTMNIPPKKDRRDIKNLRRRGGKMSIAVSHFICTNTKLVINTDKPGKLPLIFDISQLKMNDIGPSKPLQFQATLMNPKPVGEIYSSGLFGPLNELSPSDSLVAGSYFFTNADLSTLKGIGGILSSSGKYAGTLSRIEVQGQTDTPDFRLTVSGHRVPLHTDFHAIVDGTDGDTYLDPVRAKVLNSTFTARGKVVKVASPPGHDIQLDVILDDALIQDLLKLGVKTDPPVMSGPVKMHSSLSISPGPRDISDRVKLAGQFQIPDGRFSNEKLQTKIDALSLRSSGRPKLVRDAALIVVPSNIQGQFSLSDGILSFPSLRFQVPGTNALMSGRYSLDGRTFDFHGNLRFEAKLSQMTTGWKSLLLKPVDPFFHKHGAGTELPFKIAGTKSAPHFGLDFGHKDSDPTPTDSPDQADSR